MLKLALDADAFNFLRKLSLLGELLALTRPPDAKVSLYTTGYVAWHELTSIRDELGEMVKNGELTVVPIASKTPTFALFRDLQKEYDKGESELGAWIAIQAPDVVLVSCDTGVPKLARRLKIDSLDLGQLAVRLVNDGLMTEHAVEAKLEPWGNPHTGIGRPKWWKSLRESLAGKG